MIPRIFLRRIGAVMYWLAFVVVDVEKVCVRKGFGTHRFRHSHNPHRFRHSHNPLHRKVGVCIFAYVIVEFEKVLLV